MFEAAGHGRDASLQEREAEPGGRVKELLPGPH